MNTMNIKLKLKIALIYLVDFTLFMFLIHQLVVSLFYLSKIIMNSLQFYNYSFTCICKIMVSTYITTANIVLYKSKRFLMNKNSVSDNA